MNPLAQPTSSTLSPVFRPKWDWKAFFAKAGYTGDYYWFIP